METSLSGVEARLGELSPLVVSWVVSAAGALALLIVGFIVSGLVGRWIRRGLTALPTVDETLGRFLGKVAQYAVLVIFLVAVLAQFGVQTTSIIAALGAAGLAIGLALQGTLSNIAAGIMLLVLRPFRVGEFVDAGSISGTVVEIGLFTTEFQQADGVYVMAPNSSIWNQAIVNYSRNPTRRVELTVGIDYEDSIETARGALLALVADDERVLSEPEPMVFVSNLGDSSVDLTLRAWTATGDFFATANDVRRRAKERFDEEEISIPFPQQVFTYREAPPAANS